MKRGNLVIVRWGLVDAIDEMRSQIAVLDGWMDGWTRI